MQQGQMQLEQGLRRLERALLTPLVSGELESWSQTARDAFLVAERLIRETVDRHADEIKQIQEDDPELSTEVEKLVVADAEILEAIDQLRTRFDTLCDAAPKVEPAELTGSSVAQKLGERGIALIVEVRRQEEAIRTWQHEALTRDRGLGD